MAPLHALYNQRDRRSVIPPPRRNKMILTRLAHKRMRNGESAYPSSTTRDKAYWRRYLGLSPEPSQIKIDFSKMPQKPVSEGFVFPKSAEQEIAEARAKIAELEEALKKYCDTPKMAKNERTRYNGVMILKHKNNFEYDESYSEEDIIALAIKERCPIVQKAGPNAKWYLKGRDMPHDHLKSMIETQLKDPIPEYKNKYIILIKI